MICSSCVRQNTEWCGECKHSTLSGYLDFYQATKQSILEISAHLVLLNPDVDLKAVYEDMCYALGPKYWGYTYRLEEDDEGNSR